MPAKKETYAAACALDLSFTSASAPRRSAYRRSRATPSVEELASHQFADPRLLDVEDSFQMASSELRRFTNCRIF